MQLNHVSGILIENHTIESNSLKREVKFDCYLPAPVNEPSGISLLLINDGQNLKEMGFETLLEEMHTTQAIRPVFCVGIHAGEERKMEYGIAAHPDYLGRGAKAGAYTSFILDELIPFIHATYRIHSFQEKAFAGFSLGGLTALDIVWNHPGLFTKAGIFSGSLWWRSMDQDNPGYDDHKHRLMHQQIRQGEYKPGLQFFFQCGNRDESKDRNNNGIIDSIDDTQDLIKELELKGYDRARDIYYLEMPDGRHDIATWGLAIPEFLKWGFGVK